MGVIQLNSLTAGAMMTLSSKRHPAEYLSLAHSTDKPAGIVDREKVTLQRLLNRLEQNSDESESRKLSELIQIVEAEQGILAGSLPMPVLKELAGKLTSTTPRQNGGSLNWKASSMQRGRSSFFGRTRTIRYKRRYIYSRKKTAD